MLSEIDTKLSERTVELVPGNTGFCTYPFVIPKKNGMSYFLKNLKPLNQFITGTKFKMTTIRQIKEAIHPDHFAISLDIK